uniref:Uncharacterized protein n=1 Tax=Chromera velia CCMP2878 TaxID=1169474 RepID=A0A0G4F6I7_9ALVE|eukprot:Cvel_15450.t1-p1 / transcript=Cvel_15450.t1 / gene=Cvel_15450 / organism=Chromera_velia_CCMP2878 / gene_product=hypothetical protein / transcript_product=hypothetical protein / location=Cvel_scaffold1144:1517-5802(+) / protein_length=221 / sequence_SO=supercontig / SO=protein_coding / is_pseudo=false
MNSTMLYDGPKAHRAIRKGAVCHILWLQIRSSPDLVAVNKKYFEQFKKKMEGAVDNLFDTTKAKVAERLERGVTLFRSKPPLTLRGGVYALSLLLDASKNRKGMVYHQTLKLWFGGVKEEQFVTVYDLLDPFGDDKLAQFITVALVVCHDLAECEEIVLGACFHKNGNLKGKEIDHLRDVCQKVINENDATLHFLTCVDGDGTQAGWISLQIPRRLKQEIG